MNGNLQITKKNVILLMSGVLVAAFLGVSGASYFIQWNSARKRDAQMREKVSLQVGQLFPRGSFLDIDGRSYDLVNGLEGRKTILIFFTTECPHCVATLERWAQFFSNRDSKYQVAGISYEPIAKLQKYKMEKNLGFPIFNDSIGRFTGVYKIEVYPTIIGVNEQKRVAFIEIGNNPRKTAEDYLKEL